MKFKRNVLILTVLLLASASGYRTIEDLILVHEDDSNQFAESLNSLENSVEILSPAIDTSKAAAEENEFEISDLETLFEQDSRTTTGFDFEPEFTDIEPETRLETTTKFAFENVTKEFSWYQPNKPERRYVPILIDCQPRIVKVKRSLEYGPDVSGLNSAKILAMPLMSSVKSKRSGVRKVVKKGKRYLVRLFKYIKNNPLIKKSASHNHKNKHVEVPKVKGAKKMKGIQDALAKAATNLRSKAAKVNEKVSSKVAKVNEKVRSKVAKIKKNVMTNDSPARLGQIVSTLSPYPFLPELPPPPPGMKSDNEHKNDLKKKKLEAEKRSQRNRATEDYLHLSTHSPIHRKQNLADRVPRTKNIENKSSHSHFSNTQDRLSNLDTVKKTHNNNVPGDDPPYPPLSTHSPFQRKQNLASHSHSLNTPHSADNGNSNGNKNSDSNGNFDDKTAHKENPSNSDDNEKGRRKRRKRTTTEDPYKGRPTLPITLRPEHRNGYPLRSPWGGPYEMPTNLPNGEYKGPVRRIYIPHSSIKLPTEHPPKTPSNKHPTSKGSPRPRGRPTKQKKEESDSFQQGKHEPYTAQDYADLDAALDREFQKEIDALKSEKQREREKKNQKGDHGSPFDHEGLDFENFGKSSPGDFENFGKSSPGSDYVPHFNRYPKGRIEHKFDLDKISPIELDKIEKDLNINLDERRKEVEDLFKYHHKEKPLRIRKKYPRIPDDFPDHPLHKENKQDHSLNKKNKQEHPLQSKLHRKYLPDDFPTHAPFQDIPERMDRGPAKHPFDKPISELNKPLKSHKPLEKPGQLYQKPINPLKKKPMEPVKNQLPMPPMPSFHEPVSGFDKWKPPPHIQDRVPDIDNNPLYRLDPHAKIGPEFARDFTAHDKEIERLKISNSFPGAKSGGYDAKKFWPQNVESNDARGSVHPKPSKSNHQESNNHGHNHQNNKHGSKNNKFDRDFTEHDKEIERLKIVNSLPGAKPEDYDTQKFWNQNGVRFDASGQVPKTSKSNHQESHSQNHNNHGNNNYKNNHGHRVHENNNQHKNTGFSIHNNDDNGMTFHSNGQPKSDTQETQHKNYNTHASINLADQNYNNDDNNQDDNYDNAPSNQRGSNRGGYRGNNNRRNNNRGGGYNRGGGGAGNYRGGNRNNNYRGGGGGGGRGGGGGGGRNGTNYRGGYRNNNYRNNNNRNNNNRYSDNRNSDNRNYNNRNNNYRNNDNRNNDNRNNDNRNNDNRGRGDDNDSRDESDQRRFSIERGGGGVNSRRIYRGKNFRRYGNKNQGSFKHQPGNRREYGPPGSNRNSQSGRSNQQEDYSRSRSGHSNQQDGHSNQQAGRSNHQDDHSHQREDHSHQQDGHSNQDHSSQQDRTSNHRDDYYSHQKDDHSNKHGSHPTDNHSSQQDRPSNHRDDYHSHKKDDHSNQHNQPADSRHSNDRHNNHNDNHDRKQDPTNQHGNGPTNNNSNDHTVNHIHVTRRPTTERTTKTVSYGLYKDYEAVDTSKKLKSQRRNDANKARNKAAAEAAAAADKAADEAMKAWHKNHPFNHPDYKKENHNGHEHSQNGHNQNGHDQNGHKQNGHNHSPGNCPDGSCDGKNKNESGIGKGGFPKKVNHDEEMDRWNRRQPNHPDNNISTNKKDKPVHNGQDQNGHNQNGHKQNGHNHSPGECPDGSCDGKKKNENTFETTDPHTTVKRSYAEEAKEFEEIADREGIPNDGTQYGKWKAVVEKRKEKEFNRLRKEMEDFLIRENVTAIKHFKRRPYLGKNPWRDRYKRSPRNSNAPIEVVSVEEPNDELERENVQEEPIIEVTKPTKKPSKSNKNKPKSRSKQNG